MGFKFNPFSGNFDQTGSGGGSTVFDGEVQFFSDLPQTVGTPPVNSAYLVRESEGTIWFGNKKQKGIYIRSGNSGVRNDDWTYGGEYPVTSVNGATGAITVAAEQHAAEHEAGEADEIKAMAALVATEDASLNGIYVPNSSGTTSGGRLTLYKPGTRENTKLEYNPSLSGWYLIKNTVVQLAGQEENAAYAWTPQAWIDPRNPQSLPNGGTVTRAGLEMLARRAADGTSNVATATTSFDGLMSSADKTKLNGIAANATANTASSATPSSLGTAAAGSATDYARADHTHSAEVSDSAFRVTGSTDATKKVAIEVDTNVPSGQTVTLTAPSASGTLALAGAAPAAHAASHAAAGSDPLAPSDIGAAASNHTHILATDIATALAEDPDLCRAALNLGDMATEPSSNFSTAGHGHGNLTSDGKVGSTSGLPLVTTTAGAVTTLALGTANQVLRVNSGASGVEFADPAAAGVTSVSGTAPIVSSGGTTPTISVTVGTTANTVAAGDDSRITGAAQKSANLSDLASASTARTNLGVAIGTDVAAASHTHTASAISDSTTAGRAILTAADAAAQRTSLGLATIATSGSASDLGSGTVPIGRLGASGTPSGSTYLAGDNTWKAAGGVTTGSVDNAVLRADGVGGSTSQSSDLVIDDYTSSTQGNVMLSTRLVSFSCTATASDDFVTATGHTFSNGDQVVFTSLTGGSGLTANIRYFVVSAETNKFKVSTSAGGAAINITTDATAGTVQRIAAVVIAPQNIGALILGPKPDGTTVGGNARGAGAIDLQLGAGSVRGNANQVASGDDSVIIGGNRNRASGACSAVVGGISNSATGADSFIAAGSFQSTASGARSVCLGTQQSTASGQESAALFGLGGQATAENAVAIGDYALADRTGIIAHTGTGGVFSALGDAQRFRAVLRNKTTNATPTELFLNGSSVRLTIPSGKVIAGIINCMGVKSDGSAVAHYVREFCGKNVAGFSSLVGSVTTIGADQEDNASTDISVTISDANDAVTISVTGIASETWRWVASVDAVEVAYGT